MDNLLDYLLYALFGHNVTGVRVGTLGHVLGTPRKSWTITFEDHVYITIDEHDLNVIRALYDARVDHLDDEERTRYMKIFDICQ